jgi:cell division protein FtsI (penicillin-binding protein 3)
MLGRTDRRLRICLVLGFFVVFGAAAVLRMGYWQVARGAELQQDALGQLEQPIEQPAVRGDILDRNGYPLATTAYRDTLVAYPDQIDAAHRQGVTDALAGILKLNAIQRRELFTKLGLDSQYQVLDRELSDDQSQLVHEAMGEGTLPGIGLETHAVRLYPDAGGQPDTTLASQLLGFVTADGAGTYGVEQQYNSILAGKPELISASRDADGNVLQSSEQVVDPGVNGQSIRLTIDASLQLQLEKELYAAWVADGSRSASAVIMDPNTGEILAWASVPGYDANAYGAQAQVDPSVFQDPVISQVYEPGSVMKMFTAAAAMVDGKMKPGTIVHDQTKMTFGTQTIHDSDHKSMGNLPLRDAIAYSRNLATANVALHLAGSTAASAAKLYATWKTFGIGSRTGVDVADEVSGIAQDPSQVPWQPLDLANRAFGQSVAVTPLQLANGYATMVNGGYRVQPHVLAAIDTTASPDPAPKRVISETLAGELKGVLEHVTASVPFYAQGALIPHYEVGGKTGTAQVWDATRDKYTYNRFNFSFVGYAGGDVPKVIIAVRIADAVPNAPAQGQLELIITSFQLFHRIASDALARFDVPKASDPDAGLPEPGSAAQRDLDPGAYRVWLRQQHHGTSPPGHQQHDSGG